MKRKLIALMCIIVVVIILGLAKFFLPRFVMENHLESMLSDDSQNVYYCAYQKIYIDENVLDFSSVFTKDKERLLEVYLIDNNLIYFSYNYYTDGIEFWCLASINTDGTNFKTIYVDEFSNSKNSVEYNRLFDVNYSNRTGYYFNDKIILTDHVKLVEYNLKTDNCSFFSYADYKFPNVIIDININDYNHLYINYKGEIIELKLAEFLEANNEFSKLTNKRTWERVSYFKYFFDNVQIVNDEIYLIGRIMNYNGESYALIFRYNNEAGVFECVDYYFTCDVITNSFYVINRTQQTQGDG